MNCIYNKEKSDDDEKKKNVKEQKKKKNKRWRKSGRRSESAKQSEGKCGVSMVSSLSAFYKLIKYVAARNKINCSDIEMKWKREKKNIYAQMSECKHAALLFLIVI